MPKLGFYKVLFKAKLGSPLVQSWVTRTILEALHAAKLRSSAYRTYSTSGISSLVAAIQKIHNMAIMDQLSPCGDALPISITFSPRAHQYCACRKNMGLSYARYCPCHTKSSPGGTSKHGANLTKRWFRCFQDVVDVKVLPHATET